MCCSEVLRKVFWKPAVTQATVNLNILTWLQPKILSIFNVLIIFFCSYCLYNHCLISLGVIRRSWCVNMVVVQTVMMWTMAIMCACIVLSVAFCGVVEQWHVFYCACLLTVFGNAFIVNYCDIYLKMAWNQRYFWIKKMEITCFINFLHLYISNILGVLGRICFWEIRKCPVGGPPSL